MLELENKESNKEEKEENCENHGEQRIEADPCTGDLESNQSTLEPCRCRPRKRRVGGREREREGGGKAHSSLALDHFTLLWRIPRKKQ